MGWLYNGNRNAFASITDFGTLYVGGNAQIVGTLLIDGFTQINDNMTVDGIVRADESAVQEAGHMYFNPRAGSTRTTWQVQCKPRFGNSWTSGTLGDEVTAVRDPTGNVTITGELRNATPGLRANGIYVFDFGATTFAQTFKPQVNVHTMCDGKRGNVDYGPVLVLDATGVARCYNFDAVTAGSLSYWFTMNYNVLAEPGKYEGTGGY